MNGYLYILESSHSGQRYIGSTNNPDRRLSQHNADAVRSTRGKGPWKILHLSEFPSPKQARSAEAFVKKQKSRHVVDAILRDEFVWPETMTVGEL